MTCSAANAEKSWLSAAWKRFRFSVRSLFLIALVLFPVAVSAAEAPRSISVVIDNNYPPYIFLDQDGKPQGLLKDMWSLWSEKTGIRVDLKPMEWDQALSTMKQGKADVIDTIFQTAERQNLLDFSKSYADISVNIFFRKGVSGITNAASLQGFTVGVKAGDTCIDYLTQHGITTLKTYPSYEKEVEAAIHDQIKVMCIDKPPALYLLNKLGAADEFRHSPSLYVGHFHWAVAKGRADLMHLVSNGFSQITPEERESVYQHWLGESLPANHWVTWVSYSLAALSLVIVLLVGWNWALRSRVADRTRKLSETLDSLKASHEQMRLLLEYASDAIFGMDISGNCTFVNKAFLRMHGYDSEDEVLGKNLHALIHHTLPDGRPYPKEECNVRLSTLHGQSTHVDDEVSWRRDGTSFPVEYRSHPMYRDGQVVGAVVALTDISERKSAEAKVEHMAYHDQLTGLPNRVLFLDRLNQALAAARRAERYGAIIFIDLDQFKKINDVYGHNFGDMVLQDVATRLQDGLRESDTVARFGGDEFVILLPSLEKEEASAASQALAVGEKLRKALEVPGEFGGQSYVAAASIGILLFPRQTESVGDLIREADIAMYRAKDRGRNTVVFFEKDMHKVITERFELEQELRAAIGKDNLELFLQSKVDKAGRVTGAEALLRWRHPERGLVPPAVFIPLAEEIGLIGAIGEWVLRESCRLIVQLNAMGLSMHLSVNVSPRQFHQLDFVERVKAVLAETGADPVYLTLEITENLLVDRTTEVVARMLALSELGIRFSIDDFGTGYSSLSYLKRLPLNELKIDKGFVQDIPHDVNDVALVETILSMAHHLGFEVVAEGVETREQFDFLAERQCEHFQGYYFHRPQPAEDWIATLNGKDS